MQKFIHYCFVFKFTIKGIFDNDWILNNVSFPFTVAQLYSWYGFGRTTFGKPKLCWSIALIGIISSMQKW